MSRDKDAYLSSYIPALDAFLDANEFDLVNNWVTSLIKHYRLFAGKANPRTLELGCGPGHLTSRLSTLQPVELVSVDFSQQMIDRVKPLARSMPALHLMCQDIMTLDEPPQSYDVIATSFTLHHLLPQERGELFKRCRRWLKPDGVFVNGDVFHEADAKVGTFINSWHDAALKTSLSEAQFQARLEHRKHEYRCTVRQQLDGLHNAGFTQAASTHKCLDRSLVMAFG